MSRPASSSRRLLVGSGLAQLCLGLGLATAQAGPWPKAAREVFASAKAESDGSQSYWAEIGIGHGRWFSFQNDLPAHGPQTVSANLNQALPPLGGWQISASVGVAYARADRRYLARDVPDWLLYRPVEIHPEQYGQISFAIGRGLKNPWPGWTSLVAQYRHGETTRTVKLDGTLGYRPRDWLNVIAQVHHHSDNVWGRERSISAASVFKVSDRLSLELGVIQSLTRKDELRGKIGLWFSY